MTRDQINNAYRSARWRRLVDAARRQRGPWWEAVEVESITWGFPSPLWSQMPLTAAARPEGAA